MSTNPYHEFVSKQARLLQEAKSYPLGTFSSAPRPEIAPNAPKVLFFAPHPDDECIVGGCALRLLRQARWNVIDVAVTLGSLKPRQPERLRELQNACRYLGYGLELTAPNGLERVTLKSRTEDPAHWQTCVKAAVDILARHQPRVVMCPHERDWNATHIGTHYLVMDALKHMPAGFECTVIETEFWGQLDDANLLIEISAADLADQITATTFHVGEVSRNPYHLLLPAWMLNNVLRGSEIVGGQGGQGANFTFGVSHRLRKWNQGQLVRTFQGGKILPYSENLSSLL